MSQHLLTRVIGYNYGEDELYGLTVEVQPITNVYDANGVVIHGDAVRIDIVVSDRTRILLAKYPQSIAVFREYDVFRCSQTNL